jgi:hypothetical protein
LTSLSEDIEPAAGAREGRAVVVVGGLLDGVKLPLGARDFLGTVLSETEARGRGVAADLADTVESGETTDARDGVVEGGLAAVEEDVAEDNLPDVEVDSVDDRAGAAGFGGACDGLRVGAPDGLGGIATFEDGAEVEVGDFLTAGLEAVGGLRLEETWGAVENFPVIGDVTVVFEIGGGTAFVTPMPNLPEFKICNADGAC